VIGVGGYASVPVILAAFLLGVPRVLLEPNVRPGLANRLLAPFSSLVIAAFEGTRRRLRSRRVDVLGVPIRPELLIGRERPKKVGQTLLILGGSQGAQAVNDAVIGVLPLLQEKKERLSVIHQTGKQDIEKVRRAYRDSGLSARVEPFIEEMAQVYAEADLVISRSGAGTLAELTALGLPSILIPFPFASGHQEDNAKEIETAGGATVLLQRDLTPQRLAEAILKLLGDPAALAAMGEASRRLGRPNAAEEIVAACRRLTKTKAGGR
jgi:UDP-N-acetylglucosamine--N-acetylmuramyl-(pentapeptide) pyrophosphoryl-undecaprenol N-acetylglucosamine transferase